MRILIVVCAATVIFADCINRSAPAQATQPSTQPSTQPAADSSGEHSEKILVLIGMLKNNDGSFMAYLVNIETKNVTPIHVGDKVARGKISSINLQKVQYQVGDSNAELTIGQNLAGQTIFGGNPVGPSRQPATGPGSSL